MAGQNQNGALDQGDSIDISIYIYRYISVVKRYLLNIIIIAILVAGVAYLYFSSLTPIYQASSTLIIEESNLGSNVVDEFYYQGGYRTDEMLVRVEVLKSEQLARRVVKQLSLTDYPELNPYHPDRKKAFSIKGLILSSGKNSEQQKPSPSADEVINATAISVMSSISLNAIPRSPMVRVNVSGSNPELIAKIANAMADAYIEQELDTNVENARLAVSGLDNRVKNLKEQLDSSSKALQKFIDDNNLIDRGDKGDSSILLNEMEMVSKDLLEARSTMIELESSYKLVKNLDSMSYTELASVPFILNDESVSQLQAREIQAQLELTSLSERYGEKHPKLVEAKLAHTIIKDSLEKQMVIVARTMLQEYKDVLNKERKLTALVEEKRKEVRRLNNLEFKKSEYRRNFESDQELYGIFFERVREATEFSDLLASKAKIITPARIPRVPVKPKAVLMTILAFVGTLGAGVALVILIELLDATIKDPNDVDNKLGHPLLAVIPLIENSGESKDETEPNVNLAKAFVESEIRGFIESVRTLRTSLTLAGLKDPVQVILMTSTVASEGKTTMSANLAEAYGQMEKTILIDADMRRPSLGKSLGLSPNTKGLSNAVAYPETLDECINSLPGLGIDVITSGPMPPNPLELLSSKNFEEVLNTLKGRYQKIIIDSAPTRLVSDALYLSSLSDGVVYVVKSDATPDRMVMSGLSRFGDSNARVLGVILNQFDVDKGAKYSSYSYYGGYYEGYGPDETKS